MSAQPARTDGFFGVVADYLAEASTPSARSQRARTVTRFTDRFGSPAGWAASTMTERMDVDVDVRTFAGFAAVAGRTPVDPPYVVGSGTAWSIHVTALDPAAVVTFTSEAASLGFSAPQTRRMWARLAQIAVISGQSPDTLSVDQYVAGREAITTAVTGRLAVTPKSLSIPLYGLDAVMFHRGQAPRPKLRQHRRPAHQTGWDQVAATAPQLAATMRRYLDQLRVSLRASSVTLIDTTLNQFAGMLITAHPDVTCIAGVQREHVEAYKTWLAARPGYRGQPTISKTTIGMRIGHLHAFFERIVEWGYHDAPARIPVYNSDRPIKDTPLPRFLDDPTAARFMTAARELPDEFDRLVIELLARTGMRKGELLGLTIDAVVQIGSKYWLRTPVGKLHNDRYLPLHPALKELLDQWLAERPDWQDSDLMLTDRGRPIPGQRVDRAVTRAATAAGIGHVHPHQLRHTLATQAVNRGMSLEAIAALLGHKSLKMTMVYARISDRTVAEEYFKVTEKVEALYHRPSQAALPAEAEGPEMKRLRTETNRLLGNGYCTRPEKLECRFETICEACTFFQTTIEFRTTLRRQRDDAADKGQASRQQLYDQILKKLDQTGS